MVSEVPVLEELRSLVRADGRSDRQIAIAAEIHPVTFSAFMAGRRGLSIETAEKLAQVLHHPIELRKKKKN
jgi:plasmid maintenance system antidote protein VapI